MTEGTLSVAEARERIDAAKGVIFDNDGTLVDSMPVHYMAWQKALNENGIDFPKEKFYAWAGAPAAEIIKALAQSQKVTDFSVTSILEVRQELLERELRNVKKIDVVVDLLEYALQKGKTVAVASGNELGDVLGSLNYAGIDDTKFSSIVTAEDVAIGKPDPEIFLTAASRMGVDPSDCIGLEDGDMGLQALDAAGIAKIDVRHIDGYPHPSTLSATS